MSQKYEVFKRIICEFKYDNTYKAAWAKALIELSTEIPVGGEEVEISLKQIAAKFLKYYWNQTIYYNWLQSSNPNNPPEVITVVRALIEKYYVTTGIREPNKYELAKPYISEKDYQDALNRITNTLKKDVSYRFLVLDSMSQDIYQYNRAKNSISISTPLLREISDSRNVLFDLVDYRWGLILDYLNGDIQRKKDTVIHDDAIIDKEKLKQYRKWLKDEAQYSKRRKIKSITTYIAQNATPSYHFEKVRKDNDTKTFFVYVHLSVSLFQKNEEGYYFTHNVDTNGYSGSFTIRLYTDDINDFFSEYFDNCEIKGNSNDFSIKIDLGDVENSIRHFQKGKQTIIALVADNKLSETDCLSVDNTGNDRSKEKNLTNADLERTTNEAYVDKNKRASLTEPTDIWIRIKHENGKYYEYIITLDAATISDKNRRIDYTSEMAREFLTAIFYKERNNKGCYNGKRYMIVDSKFGSNFGNIENTIIPNRLLLRQGGGNSSSLKNRFLSIKQLLLYSPFNRRYETIQVTFDSRSNEYFTAPFRFRRFVEDYGNPGIKLDFFSNGGRTTSFSDYNAESILASYGYSVANGTQSESKRQELLAEIVDLGILTPKRVSGFLSFFLRTHSSDKYVYARQKWGADKIFIENYKINKERFLKR